MVCWPWKRPDILLFPFLFPSFFPLFSSVLYLGGGGGGGEVVDCDVVSYIYVIYRLVLGLCSGVSYVIRLVLCLGEQLLSL